MEPYSRSMASLGQYAKFPSLQVDKECPERELSDMMTASEGGGDHGKVDVEREVA